MKLCFHFGLILMVYAYQRDLVECLKALLPGRLPAWHPVYNLCGEGLSAQRGGVVVYGTYKCTKRLLGLSGVCSRSCGLHELRVFTDNIRLEVEICAVEFSRRRTGRVESRVPRRRCLKRSHVLKPRCGARSCFEEGGM